MPDEPDDDDEHEHWSLVLPFLPVASKGGPYDDDSYTAGFVVGTIDRELATGTFPAEGRMVYPALVDQLDLVAMNHGYTMRAEPADDHWTKVEFDRAG